METVYLSLGSNLGDRMGHLLGAFEGLQSLLTVERYSSVYETSPIGVTVQPHFLNMVMAGRCADSPHHLLQNLLGLEKQLGRIRSTPGGPRVIDIDLLFFGSEVIDNPSCIVPHPRYHKRAFVLKPMCEISPEFECPLYKRTMSSLLAGLHSEDQVVAFGKLPVKPTIHVA